MQFKVLQGIALLCILASIAACKRPAEPFVEQDFNAKLKLFRNDSNKCFLFRAVCGIGKDSLIFAKYGLPFQYPYDTVFSLPLDLNTDTVRFRLLRHDNSEDTLVLSYKRQFDFAYSKWFQCRFSSIRADKLSGRLLAFSSSDSVVFSSRNDAIFQVDIK